MQYNYIVLIVSFNVNFKANLTDDDDADPAKLHYVALPGSFY